MNAAQWKARLIHAVKRAAEGYPERLDALAQRLADIDIAADALITAGFGSDGDDVPELVALVVERQEQ
ncbi:MAG: hypothetical protein IT328_06015 [Caldilineaceae bacterium]|nr:hypothetical protein [Caldilineaceae bacterium]